MADLQNFTVLFRDELPPVVSRVLQELAMRTIHLFPFRYYDIQRRAWVKARYRAQLDEIGERYAAFQLLGAAEVRHVPDDPLYNCATSRFTQT